MKELIRQYAGTAIAVVTALVLIALVSEMSVVVEKGIRFLSEYLQYFHKKK